MKKSMPKLGDKVIRVISENLHVYGTVGALYRGDHGHLLVEFQTPEGFKFMSDPSHLEIVNVDQKKETEQETCEVISFGEA